MIDDKLARLIEQDMAAEKVPGLSLVVLRRGRIDETAVLGTADTRKQIAVQEETLFEAASLTKPLFAHAVLQLIDAGQLDLDAPLFDLLPDVATAEERLLEADAADRPFLFHYVQGDPRLADVTIRRILSHTAGFQNWTGANEGLALHFDPGQRWSYAGDGFNLLQDVLTRHYGRPAEAIVRELVLQPAGMAHSVLQDGDSVGCAVAQPHDEEGEQQERETWPQFYAAASLQTTAIDFGRFLETVLNPGELAPGRLSPQIWSEMVRPQIQVNDDFSGHEGWPNENYDLAPGVYWGLGWGIEEANGRYALWHWGDNGNYKAFTLVENDSGDGLALFTNSRNGDRFYRPLTEAILPGPHPALDWLEK